MAKKKVSAELSAAGKALVMSQSKAKRVENAIAGAAARSDKLTAEERSEIARAAAQAMWKKRKMVKKTSG